MREILDFKNKDEKLNEKYRVMKFFLYILKTRIIYLIAALYVNVVLFIIFKVLIYSVFHVDL